MANVDANTLCLGRDISYFVKKKRYHFTKKFSETDIIIMRDILIDSIFAMFGGRVGIPMGTNCAPLLADLFLNSHEADCVQRLLKKLARSFNFAT
jgi:hypothetical protein